MLRNGQTYFDISSYLAVGRPQDFLNMFGHYSTLCMNGLNHTYNVKRLQEKNQQQPYNNVIFALEVRSLQKDIITTPSDYFNFITTQSNQMLVNKM